MGYGNAAVDVVAPSPLAWAVVHVDSGIVLGFVARSSCIRVSRHQNLENCTNGIKPVIPLTSEIDHLPERGLTITYVLTLPLYHVQHM